MGNKYRIIKSQAAILFDQHFKGLISKKKITVAYNCAASFLGIAIGSVLAGAMNIPLPVEVTILISTIVAVCGIIALYRAIHFNTTLSIIANNNETFQISEDKSQIAWNKIGIHGETRELKLFNEDGFTCCRMKRGGTYYYVCSGTPSEEITHYAARYAMQHFPKTPYKTPWVSVYFKCHETTAEDEAFLEGLSWNGRANRKGV